MGNPIWNRSYSNWRIIFKTFIKFTKKTIINFILAGSIFLAGAVGLEMASGWYWTEYKITPEE
ncbi:hypothetical protein ACWGOQ_0011340 [Aquimarina sp. M1]